MDIHDPARPGRSLTIDAAKGIGILLVVIAHINYTPAPLTYIYSFHMPLFFLISGMLFRREKYSTFAQFWKSRLHSLIYPYLFFYGAAFVIRVAMEFVANGLSEVLTLQYLKSFLQMFLAWGPGELANNPLWFVPCLLSVEILYFFTSKTKRWVNGSICTVLAGVGWLIKSEYLSLRWLRLLWNFDIALFAIGFYAIGSLLSERARQSLSRCGQKPHGKYLCICAALLCAVAILPIAMKNGKVSLGSGLFGNGILLYITGVLGTLGVLFAAEALKNSRFLRYLGRNTFAIMGTHVVIRDVFNIGCSFLGWPVYDNQSIRESVIPFVLVLGASLICTALYNQIRKNVVHQ